ncbi:Acyltransferase family protein [Vibrio mediterranei]|uniref:acyltransferase family protein n=1 Tax=Vibrio mediterranei TaxID=689 RepID=UPI00078214C3|nr:acyltransferase [Vibrio mediterranei]PTC02957.1 acyltransferase [Vibrio mediterranei]SBO12228.1 Acyltransferase family protein [Vibrio mediterranei]
MYYNLQYLRGIAAVAVVYFHTFHTTGYQGVSIFFVLSGFLMFDILTKTNKTATAFFLDRYFRVAPMYYLTTLIVLALGFAYDPTIVRIIQSFTFTALGAVHGVGWTLTYEFVFYTLVAASILLPLKTTYKKVAVVVILILGDFVLANILRSRGYEYGNYFYFFIAGALVNSIYTSKNLRLNSGLNLSIFILSILYLFSSDLLGWGVHPRSVDYGLINYLVPSFLIVFTAINLERGTGLKKLKWLEQLGNASYSIYLTHMIFINIIVMKTSLELNPWLILLISVVGGLLSYEIIEKPMSNLIKRKRLYHGF